MHDMTDAANPEHIAADLDGSPALAITVLADPAGQCFDVEAGNASPAQAAEAMAVRDGRGQWSVLYCGQSASGAAFAAVAAKELRFEPAENWPAKGVYLWAADPSGNIAAGRWHLPVTPLAVQDRDEGDVDVSRVADNFPAKVAGYVDGPESTWPAQAWERFARIDDAAKLPGPAPRPPLSQGVCNVNLPVLQQGATGRAVQTVQRLLGGLAVDGDFGPATHEAVVRFQGEHQLGADGIVGVHTWGALLGVPQ